MLNWRFKHHFNPRQQPICLRPGARINDKKSGCSFISVQRNYLSESCKTDKTPSMRCYAEESINFLAGWRFEPTKVRFLLKLILSSTTLEAARLAGLSGELLEQTRAGLCLRRRRLRIRSFVTDTVREGVGRQIQRGGWENRANSERLIAFSLMN